MIYICKTCNFNTSNKKDYSRHLLTDKHKKLTNPNLKDLKNPYFECNRAVSNFSDQYNKIIVESMGGSGNNDLEKEDKIIKNVAKQVLIDKDKYSNID